MERKAPEKWAVNLVAKMYRNRVKQGELADYLGVTRNYVGMVLSGDRNPPDAKEKLEAAYEAVMAKRKEA